MNPAAGTADASAHELARLRDRAREVLGHSSALLSPGVDAGAALSVLHELAATPDTARDALAVLQELQVHQVELQLQAEDLRQARLDMEAQLLELQSRQEQWPVACLTLDEDGRILEANQRARMWLGDAQAETHGRALRNFLTPGSAIVLSSMLSAVRAGRHGSARALELKASVGSPKPVWATACAEDASATHRRVLLVLMQALHADR